MMKQRTILPALIGILFTLLLPAILVAQASGTISGRVVARDGSPVSGAAIEVLGTTPRLGSFSKIDGSYSIRRVPPGTYRLKITALDCASDSTSVTVRTGAPVSLGFTLKRVPVPHKELRPMGGATTLGRSGGGASIELREMSDMSVSTPPSPTAGAAPTTKMVMRGGSADVPPTVRSATSTSGSSSEGDTRVVSPVRDTAQGPPPHPGQLTAGEWNDLLNWSSWNDVVGREEWKDMPSHWGFDPSSRVTVIVTDGERLIADAEVTMKAEQGTGAWRARTDNHGRAELFAGVDGKAGGTYRVEVRSGEALAVINSVTAPSSGQLIARLRNPKPLSDQLDLMFLVDCTGSMGDELEYLKSEMESVIDRVRDQAPPELKIRMSTNFYRDHGDEYIVRNFPFTESSFEAIGWIRDQRAENGGDFEEAVEEALADAIRNHEWSSSARARLMFLVLDAPPHYTPERLQTLHDLMAEAAAKGIRIIPVASSGINKETEFLLRLFGIYTGGTYTFLTDDSGIGESHLKPTIGDYRTEYLDDLMVRLILDWTREGVIDEDLRARLR